MQTFLLCVVSLLTLIIMARAIHMRELFLGLELEGMDLFLLFVFLVPSFMIIVMPISCMLSVFLTFLRLSSDRELVALKAGGISIYQLLPAPLAFTLLCTLITLMFSLHGIAWGMGNFRSLVLQIASTRAKVVVQPGVFNQDIIEGLTLFARNVDPVTGRLKQVIFEDRRGNGQDKSLTIIAPEGDIVTDESRGQLVFNLEHGLIYRMDDNNISVLNFDSYAVNMDLSNLFSVVDLGDIKPKEMSWTILKRTISDAQGTAKDRLKAASEMQKRLALPVSCIILGLFVMPLACSFEGVQRQLGVIVSLVMFLLYYSIFSVGLNLAETGKLSPVVGLWLANIFFAGLTIVGFYLTAKERIISLEFINAFFRRLIRRKKEKVI